MIKNIRGIFFILLLLPLILQGQGISHSAPGTPWVRWRIESNGGMAVNIQDQTTRPLDLFFTQLIGIPTTLNAPTVINDTTIIVASIADISTGDYIGIFSGVSLEDHFYFAEVLGVDGDTVEVDSPLDFAFDSLDPVISTTREINVDASPAFQTFSVTNGTAATQIDIDITRVMFQIICTNPPEFDDFGDIAGGLVRGMVLRRSNGVAENIFNAKTNGELAHLMYDLMFYATTGPQPLGVNGIVGRFTFAGQDKHGVAVRLAGGESLDLIIQDDLSSLSKFRMIAEGHVVTNEPFDPDAAAVGAIAISAFMIVLLILLDRRNRRRIKKVIIN